ncbi:MAG: hypothetical protein CW338_06680 [Clostridiales bacterium]|nr:hypothetical protein [Clostridiales bacterium]
MNDLMRRVWSVTGGRAGFSDPEKGSCEKLSASGGVKIEMYPLEGVKGDMSCTYVSVRAPLGIITAQLLVFTPVTKDAPAAMIACLHSPGKDSLHLELPDTALSPCDTTGILRTVRENPVPGEAQSSLDWYSDILLQGSLCRHIGFSDARAVNLAEKWACAYMELVRIAPACDAGQKKAKTNAVVDGKLLRDCDDVMKMYDLLGREKARKLIKSAFHAF